MSDDQINILRSDIAALKAVMEERSRSADRNSTLLRTVATVVLLQFIGTVYIAGVKTQKLDNLSDEVVQLRVHVENLTVKHL